MGNRRNKIARGALATQIVQNLAMTGGTSPPSTPTVYNFVDPDAATIVLAPGNTPCTTTLPITMIQGMAQDIALQCWNRGGQTKPAFSADDTISAAIYQSQVATPICQPATDWYTAGGTQTGFDQGQILVSTTNAQAALLQPTGGAIQYMLIVQWSPAAQPSKSALVVRVPLTIELAY